MTSVAATKARNMTSATWLLGGGRRGKEVQGDHIGEQGGGNLRNDLGFRASDEAMRSGEELLRCADSDAEFGSTHRCHLIAAALGEFGEQRGRLAVPARSRAHVKEGDNPRHEKL